MGRSRVGYPQVMNADLKIIDSRLSRVVTKIPRLGRYLLGAAVAILASTIIYQGLRMFPESAFQLASESRLPYTLRRFDHDELFHVAQRGIYVDASQLLANTLSYILSPLLCNCYTSE